MTKIFCFEALSLVSSANTGSRHCCDKVQCVCFLCSTPGMEQLSSLHSSAAERKVLKEGVLHQCPSNDFPCNILHKFKQRCLLVNNVMLVCVVSSLQSVVISWNSSTQRAQEFSKNTVSVSFLTAFTSFLRKYIF